MADYKRVSDALASGVAPAMICSTCPWDRFCITPPSMTREDVQRQIDESNKKTDEAMMKAQTDGKEPGMGMLLGSLMTSVLVGGKDTQAEVCPVLVARVRSSEGRTVVDSVRALMRSWDDDKVGS